jgi:methyl-accepting chemotaxis protein
MILDFIVIPIIFNYEKYAFKVKSELKKITNKQINVEVDTEYSQLFRARINKWKKLDFNIVTLDEDFNEDLEIVIRFYGKGLGPNIMHLQDFIDLVNSFDCDIQETETQEQSKETQEQSKETQEQSKETQEQSKETQEQSKETQEQSKETQEQSKETQEQPEETEGNVKRCILS